MDCEVVLTVYTYTLAQLMELVIGLHGNPPVLRGLLVILRLLPLRHYLPSPILLLMLLYHHVFNGAFVYFDRVGRVYAKLGSGRGDYLLGLNATLLPGVRCLVLIL